MNTKQIAAILMPILLIAVMVPLFRLIARRFGNRVGWYSGLVIYWILWGLLYPLLMLGKEAILDLIQPRGFDLVALLLVLIPVAFAAIGRFGFGIQYEKATKWALVGLLVTAIGNGVFEEILWRGTYMALFPDSIFFRIVWSSFWFGLWHYAPGSVSSGGNALRLMISAAFFGLFLSFLAQQTDTIGWSILAHTVAGIVMVI